MLPYLKSNSSAWMSWRSLLRSFAGVFHTAEADMVPRTMSTRPPIRVDAVVLTRSGHDEAPGRGRYEALEVRVIDR